MGDHVHMCVRIPPKIAVSKAVGDLKGKSAIAIARRFGKKVRNFRGGEFLGQRGMALKQRQSVYKFIALR